MPNASTSDPTAIGSFGSESGGGGFGGQNQHMNYPSMTSTYNYGSTPPGVVPPSGGFTPPGDYYQGNQYGTNLQGPGAVGTNTKLSGHEAGVPTLDPRFTQAMDAYLRSQLGQGAAPFNLSSFLPSTGGSTMPGQVSAPLTPELQQLAKFLQTGQGGGAGSQTLEQMATTGMPTDVGPAWEAMLKSEQHNIGENANALREQFAGMGDLKSSPFGTAMSDFYTQTALGQNAQLTQAEQQAQEAAAGRMSSASQFLTGESGQLGQYLQGLDQQSIQALMQEFMRTSPDYSPLLPYEQQLATTFPPVYGKTGFAASFGPALGGALGQTLGTFGLEAGPGQPPKFSMGGGG
jgi:hypothetical protein